MPTTPTEDSPTAMMTAHIERAVESGEGSAELLEQWLQGFDLPPLGMDEEPYVWILRGHAEAVERVQAEKTLASWLAEFFEKKPDVEPVGEFPDRLLYNAFLLAAGLASPDELWEPLLAVYERRALSGDYLGLDHRSALRSALSQNQGDVRLEPVWRAMATGKETDFLPGNAYNGFEALAMMPDPERGREYPALEALGEAVTHLVTMLADQPRLRGRRLERLMNRLRSLYPGREQSIFEYMSRVAEEQEWPAWATEALETARPPYRHRVRLRRLEEPRKDFWWGGGAQSAAGLKTGVTEEGDDNEAAANLEEAADLMDLAGNATRLKLLYQLHCGGELCVSDLAELLGISVSAVSQHLSKLKAYGLVVPRRDAQTVYFRLTSHSFNANLRNKFFVFWSEGESLCERDTVATRKQLR